MDDCFAILGLSRCAALNEETLHNAYAEKSRAAHPDHGGSDEQAATVNAAYETLRTPEKRLKHLLEIAAPENAKAWRTVPMDDRMMTLFSRLGKALDASGKFLEKKHRAQSALAKALLAKEEMRQREALEGLGFEIENGRKEMERRLAVVDEALPKGDADTWRELAVMQARFAYLARWQAQVRERLLALM
jgi:curved DNA-binding protein CbpA